MLPLLLAAILWVAAHVGLAGTPLRDALAARLGEGGFRAAFSVLSVVLIVLLVRAFDAAPTTPLWYAPGWLRWLLVLLMLPAFLLFFAAVTARNPTAVGGGGLEAPVRGIQRVTRHPMLWSFALWALVHIVGNGDSAALLFFGAFAVTALAGMPSLDAKLARRDPAGWRRFAARTSVLPFGAIAAGRNHLAPRELLAEIGWLAPALAVLAWGTLLHLHPLLFGVSPLPPG
ncbi:NnrU family protein [Roseomonas sp. NAR14]|uniref:NnrU family protein n=1 Tax=Roseomonas acroporae TaxID=2937791 RepID=A0A9X1YBD3_9PROT|nr:NnrU family protein [Roseomonas acroporae]MCK8785825.1 NnrU family protein [Roseomonas acroporae]